MKMSMLITVAAALNAGCSSEVSGLGDGNGQTAAEMHCLGADYIGHAFAIPTTIPDDDPAGVTIGPLQVSSKEETLLDVILSLEIKHTDTADLSFSLHYDLNSDGRYEASTPIEIYLARPEACSNGELWSCPIELSGLYFFRDEGWEGSGEDASLATFDGLTGGGSFYLTITDSAAGNSGSLASWAVYLRSSDQETNQLVGLIY